jgi:PAS domain S-box-containing protein
MSISFLLAKLKSEIFWKERVITILVTVTYLLGNGLEALTSKVVDDPPIIWIIAVILGFIVIAFTTFSKFYKYTSSFFQLFLYYVNLHMIYNYSKSADASIESESFYLIATYLLMVVTAQVLESRNALIRFTLFELSAIVVTVYLKHSSTPLLLNPLHQLIFGFILVGNLLMGLQRIRLTQITADSNINFKNLTENARDISSLFDRNLQYAYTNKAIESALGYTIKEVEGKSLLDFVNENDKQTILNTIESLTESADARKSIEYKIKTKTGELLWVESIFSNFKNANDVVDFKYFFAETRNIERRKKLEVELQYQLEVEALFLKYSNSLIKLDRKYINPEIYKLLAEAAPKLEKEIVAVYNLVNQTFRLETAWFNTEETGPANVLNTFISDIKTVTEITKKLQENEILIYQPSLDSYGKKVGLLFLKQEEALVNRRISIIPLVSNNQLMGVAVTFITSKVNEERASRINILKLLGVMISNALSRKTTEEKLAEARNANEAILKALPDWIYMVNKEGQFTRTNELSNLSPYIPTQNLVGKKFYDVLPEGVASKFMDALFQVIEMDAAESFEYKDEVILKGRWFKVILAPYRFNEFLIIVRDISELKQAQEELESKAQKLQQSNKELEEFAYIVSHDMKQPIRTIISYLGLLQKRYASELDSDAKEFIQEASNGANKMNLLIRDILNYSRMDQELDFKTNIDLRLCLEKVTKNIDNYIVSQGAQINIAHSLPVVKGNETMLSELFQNLIENGIKYNRNEKKEIIVSVKDKGTYWLFSFKDNGIGFDPKYAAQIFKIFKRLHNEAEFSGTGIGLSICAKAIERHGGKIWAESEPENGSTFFFTLPK